MFDGGNHIYLSRTFWKYVGLWVVSVVFAFRFASDDVVAQSARKKCGMRRVLFSVCGLVVEMGSVPVHHTHLVEHIGVVALCAYGL